MYIQIYIPKLICGFPDVVILTNIDAFFFVLGEMKIWLQKKTVTEVHMYI